jgi:hypothetical protein
VALLKHNTSVWSWGDGSSGKLGHGDTKPRIEPCPVETMAGEVVLQVAAGCWHSACIVEQPPFVNAGVLYTWGTGLAGQLGLGPALTATTVPRAVPGFLDKGHTVKFVACGSHHNAALTHDSQLFTWGSNKFGCLGAEIADEFATHPQRVWAFDVIFDGVGRGTPRSIAVGREFTVVACFPYAGPSEEEVLEAERQAAQAEAEAIVRARAGPSGARSRAASEAAPFEQLGKGRARSSVSFSGVQELPSIADERSDLIEERSLQDSPGGSSYASLRPSSMRGGRAAAADAAASFAGVGSYRSRSPTLSDAGGGRESPVVQVTEGMSLDIGLAGSLPRRRYSPPLSGVVSLDTLASASGAGDG